VTLANGPISTDDPWLAASATQTTGNNVDAYTDLSAPDDLDPVLRHARERLPREALARCLLTPACGLAMRSVPDAERIFAELRRAQQELRGASGHS